MSTPDIPKPHGTVLAAFKGLAIASSLLTAGQLGTATTLLPNLYDTAQSSHRVAAQHFARQHKTIKAIARPAELMTTLLCSGLAYIAYMDEDGKKWKLWAGAAGAMFSAIPWTMFVMETPATKLLWVAEVAESASTSTARRPSGIGLKVSPATPEQGKGAKGQHMAGGMLGAPGSGRDGAITPMEEFEPFEDAVMDEREYEQLRVIKLLKEYNSRNTVRFLGPLVAGVLGLWATLSA